MPETYQVKFLLLGEVGVGKSSLLLRFTDQQWLPESAAQPTIGVDTWTHELEVKGKHVNLIVWDTAGEERFRAITSSYYRDTQAIILADAPASVVIMPPESAVKIIVGNKADKGDMRQLPMAEAAAYAARMGALFIEASAKTAIGAREIFRDTLEGILE
ncbi:P-loop containing nucleoside triphosphate hydrolase protein [Multifurca ochricompacta]|uniref:P-loop containing nucleoside triphosphate hydrolase protein n=1 Tax=Multifurca ochricompacta TaxID=376703 RepID=A0AAD4LZB1_9AGAM|nr:P-loop containing nucleoside triphosphate hydrolase protein [Multifurca ochricompacta]